MNELDRSDLTDAEFGAVRAQPNRLKTITEHLRVKEMGPADHIRTKHEVKAWLDSRGNMKEAEAIVE